MFRLRGYLTCHEHHGGYISVMLSILLSIAEIGNAILIIYEITAKPLRHCCKVASFQHKQMVS